MTGKFVVVGILLCLTLCNLVLTAEAESSDDIFNESNNLDITGAAQDETQIQDDEAQIQEDEEIRTQNVESQGHGSRISVKLVADTGNTIGGGGGVAYVRWGKTSCPSTEGTSLLYSGRAAGTHYSHRGGASDLLCLPNNPQFLASRNGGARSVLYQTEYETSSGPSYQNLHDHDVPCATCITTKRNIKIMIPGRITCVSSGWTREYYGYLMADYHGHHRIQYTCVDIHAEGVPGTKRNLNGALLYHVEVFTGALPSAYRNGNEMTCVVCTM